MTAAHYSSVVCPDCSGTGRYYLENLPRESIECTCCAGTGGVSAKDVAVVIRMPADLHAAIKERAAAEERSMAQEIRHALRSHLGDMSEPRSPVNRKDRESLTNNTRVFMIPAFSEVRPV